MHLHRARSRTVCSVEYRASKAAWSKCGFNVFKCCVGNLAIKAAAQGPEVFPVKPDLPPTTRKCVHGSRGGFYKFPAAMACITTRMHLFIAMAAALGSGQLHIPNELPSE